jgi:pilus assembly protein CpaB
MKTRRIWMWSFVFGIIAAVVAYVVIFPGPETIPASSTVAANGDSKEEPEKKSEEETKEDMKSEIPQREMKNEMVPVSEGMRAVSLKVSLPQGVSGYIEPNSYIDVIAYQSDKDDKKNEYRTAKLILQNVKVLTSGKSADAEDEALRYETVTVEVTPQQGVELSLASLDQDGFYFMLRGEDDHKIAKEPISYTRKVIKEGKSDE